MKPNPNQDSMVKPITPTFSPNDSLNRSTKQKYWDAATGLQAVDNLNISKYLETLIIKHLNNNLAYPELEANLINYYQSNTDFSPDKEADLVAIAIYAILADETPFILDINTFKAYHHFLFKNLDPTLFHPGEFRIVNIIKKEHILNNDTVRYEDFNSLTTSIQNLLNYEKSIYYLSMNAPQKARYLADFTAKLWRVHPFREGNTRTTATFIQKHIKTIHLHINNEIFKNNSAYFRGALVRANYNNPTRGFPANSQYLINFFENLLLGADHPLDPESLKY